MSDNSTAIVFPGQGSQRQGMARDFYEAEAESRAAFEEASDACGLDLTALCFGDDERLSLTEYAQPALLTAEIAMTRVLETRFGLRGAAFGGHSLGEYTALVAAGVMSLGQAARIVRERGRLMQDAVPVGRGRMVAVFVRGLDLTDVERCTEGIDASIANDNSPEQIVVSGLSADIDAFETRLSETFPPKSFRAIPLKVSAPFHCGLMAGIEPAFSEVLRAARLAAPERAASVTSNYSGGFHDSNEEHLREKLVGQISARVRWRQNMDALQGRCERVVEVGPAPILRGFFKSVGLAIAAIHDLPSAEKTVEALEKGE